MKAESINLTKLGGGPSKHPCSRQQIAIGIPGLTVYKWISCKLKQIKTVFLTTLPLLQILGLCDKKQEHLPKAQAERIILSLWLSLSQTSFLKKGSYLYFVYNLQIYKQLYIFLSYLHVITQSTIQICNSEITKQPSNPLGLAGILLLIAH